MHKQLVNVEKYDVVRLGLGKDSASLELGGLGKTQKRFVKYNKNLKL